MDLRWLSAVFTHPHPVDLGFVALKTAVVYLFLVAGLRIAGTRELGQMNLYDLVLVIVLANSVQNAMVGSDTTLLGGLVAAATLLLLNRILNALVERSPKLEHLLVGEPSLIISNGHILKQRMRRLGITPEQLFAALREHGLERPEDAAMCVLEVDGSLSIVPKDAQVHRTRRHFRALRLS
ncbi:MAG: DUF421 domain-containing protein [Chthonomonadales bacterium]